MIVCRICLSQNIHKDLFQLQYDLRDLNKNRTDILLFCLDIRATNDSVESKLCVKCYKKLITFYKFKVLALESNRYFENLRNDKGFVVLIENDDIKEEAEEKHSVVEEIDSIMGIKEEYAGDFQSDDELLICIKQQKEFVLEDSKENLDGNAIPAPAKKKRGRKKQEGITEKLKICDECGKGVRQLKEHMKRHKDISLRKVLKCKSCDKVFSNHGARYRHNKHKHLGFKELCPICNKSVTQLKVHMRSMHSPEALKYPCATCERRFISQTKLMTHALTHTKDRPFICDSCQSTFRTKVSLSSHIRSVHDREKQHLCQYCSKGFFKKYHLQLHIRTHTKEKPYKCEECGKQFATRNVFNIHRKRHAGEKNVPCKFCDMTFICSSALTSHMVTHTKEKRHPCQYCGVRFYRSDHRLKHERTAHLKHMHISAT